MSWRILPQDGLGAPPGQPCATIRTYTLTSKLSTSSMPSWAALLIILLLLLRHYQTKRQVGIECAHERHPVPVGAARPRPGGRRHGALPRPPPRGPGGAGRGGGGGRGHGELGRPRPAGRAHQGPDPGGVAGAVPQAWL